MIKNSVLFLFFIFISSFALAQNKADFDAIDQVFKEQVGAWNRGDLVGFMQGYWQSEELKFVGKNGITYGWKNTLERYQKGYPDKAAMGELLFDILTRDSLGKNHCLIVGKWTLKRKELGDLTGHFSVIFRKIKGKWLIIADHSS